MKKLFLTVAISAFAWCASAQSFFLTGTGTFETNTTYDVNTTYFLLQIGKELNDVFAVSLGGGMQSSHYDGYDPVNVGLVGASLRVTPWNNGKFFTDLEWVNLWAFHDENNSWTTAVAPCLRYRINDHFDISTSVVTLGWVKSDGETQCYSQINFIPTTFSLSYRF